MFQTRRSFTVFLSAKSVNILKVLCKCRSLSWLKACAPGSSSPHRMKVTGLTADLFVFWRLQSWHQNYCNKAKWGEIFGRWQFRNVNSKPSRMMLTKNMRISMAVSLNFTTTIEPSCWNVKRGVIRKFVKLIFICRTLPSGKVRSL